MNGSLKFILEFKWFGKKKNYINDVRTNERTTKKKLSNVNMAFGMHTSGSCLLVINDTKTLWTNDRCILLLELYMFHSLIVFFLQIMNLKTAKFNFKLFYVWYVNTQKYKLHTVSILLSSHNFFSCLKHMQLSNNVRRTYAKLNTKKKKIAKHHKKSILIFYCMNMRSYNKYFLLYVFL